ncbi:MAG: Swt1 family HEPN domain-containing protein [Candidatus Zixiibacteriota bacterium]
MVDRRIKKLLLDKLQITQQAVSLRAKKLKATYGPMTTEEAVYVIAHQEGIDLSRFLPIQQLDRVRSLVPKDLPSIDQAKTVVKAKKVKVKRTSSYPLVQNRVISRSVVIGHESFPQMFVLENSIRELIRRILSEVYGKDWWIKAVSKNIQQVVSRTMDKEKRYPHRPKRGLHPIFYSNFDDLKQIVLQNRKQFANAIINFQWFEVQMNEVYMARNSLAHNTPITDDDAARIRLFHREWALLLETAGYK